MNIKPIKITLVKCIECNKLSPYPSKKAEGRACKHCRGYTVPYKEIELMPVLNRKKVVKNE